MKKKFLLIPLLILVCLVLFVEAVFVLVPSGVVESALKKRLMDDAGIVIEAKSFEKVFPLGYEAKGVRLMRKGKAGNIYITSVKARFSPMSLVSLRPGAVLSGDIYGGGMKGRVGKGIGMAYAHMDISGAMLPPIEVFGKIVPGPTDIQVNITAPKGKPCAEGFLKARARGGEIRDFSIMGLGIKKEKISEEGLDIRFARCRAYVKSAWIKGDTFSARARGVLGMQRPLGNSPMEMRIEVSPKGKLMEDLNKLKFLRPYRMSVGYYRAIIRGTPSAPLISAE